MPTNVFELARAALLDLIEQRLPDNTTELITPLALRTVLQSMVHSGFIKLTDALVGPNLRPDLRKAVRWYGVTTPGYSAGNGPIIADIPPLTMCLGTTITVETGPDGYNRDYQLVYDGSTPPAFTVYRDATFTGPTIGAKLVLVGSEEAQQASVTVFDPHGDDLPQGYRVLYEVSGRTRQYAARPVGGLKKANFGGVLPTPSGAGTDANYLEIPLAAGDVYTPLVVAGVATVQALATAGQLAAGKSYYILRSGQPDVEVQALSASKLALYGYRDPDGAQPVFGRYDLANNTFSDGVPGADLSAYYTKTQADGRYERLVADDSFLEKKLQPATRAKFNLNTQASSTVTFRDPQRDFGEIFNNFFEVDTAGRVPGAVSWIKLGNGVPPPAEPLPAPFRKAGAYKHVLGEACTYWFCVQADSSILYTIAPLL